MCSQGSPIPLSNLQKMRKPWGSGPSPTHSTSTTQRDVTTRTALHKMLSNTFRRTLVLLRDI